MIIFSVKDFSATILLMILKFGTKLDSDESYCVTKQKPHIAYQSLYFVPRLLCRKKTATDCLSVPLFIHFSFSPMEISVTDFSAPIRASDFKFCVHFQVGQVYCVNEN